MGKSYVKDWDIFFEEVIDLFMIEPFQVRLQVKYKGSHNLAVVKATNNRKAYMYKCRTENDLKKLESLIKATMQILSNTEIKEGNIVEPIGAGVSKKKTKKRA